MQEESQLKNEAIRNNTSNSCNATDVLRWFGSGPKVMVVLIVI